MALANKAEQEVSLELKFNDRFSAFYFNLYWSVRLARRTELVMTVENEKKKIIKSSKPLAKQTQWDNSNQSACQSFVTRS